MEEFFRWFIKGYKALDGWDRLWAILIVLALFVIASLYAGGCFDGVLSKIGEILKKIDHSIDHSANRLATEKKEIDEAELIARTDALSAEVEEAKKRIEQRNRYKQGIYSEEQKRSIQEAREYFGKCDPEGLEIYESALKDGAEPIETFNFLKSMW